MADSSDAHVQNPSGNKFYFDIIHIDCAKIVLLFRKDTILKTF